MVLAGPWMFLLYAFHAGLLTIWDLVAHQRRLGDVFRYSTWRDEMFARCFERVAPAVAESMDKSALPALAQQAQGVVMDIGPGSGEQLRRFDVSKITRIYGVEPNESLFPALRDNIKKAGLESVYTIVPSGIENKDKLEEYGIVENSMDTVVTIHVLCSVPQPQEMVSALYRYLRPGGQLIYFEHVRNTTFPASLVQGCPLLRDRPVASADSELRSLDDHLAGGAGKLSHKSPYLQVAGRSG
ncbi:MAG: hypothetical protein M1816_002563 [Peltula sp. TS41687]|nr:MAG: hypothetical protein M1816_002563 [Peltula sp. TS41687]